MGIKLSLWIFCASICAAQTFQLRGNSAEIIGTTNGSVVTPVIGPVGSLVVNGTGSVTFAPTPAIPPSTSGGTGVYFLNCCANTNSAFVKFVGAQLSNIFSAGQGSVTFYLTSRANFADRQAYGPSNRSVFDVEDVLGTHELGFYTVAITGITPRLEFGYYQGLGIGNVYSVPIGTEDALFGNGIMMKVSLAWVNGIMTLSLNNQVVQSSRYAAPVYTWGANSGFWIGGASDANSCDDIISNFTVAAGPLAPTAPTITSTASAVFPFSTPSSFTVSATGTPTPTLSVTGTLPPGVTFDPSTGALAGTSTAASTYPLTFTATNSVNTVSQSFTLVVGGPTVTFTCPVVWNSNTQTLTIPSCSGAPLIPSTAFSTFSLQLVLTGGSVVWQIDNKKFAANFGSSP